MNINEILRQLSSGKTLTRQEAYALANYIATEDFDPLKVSAALSMMSLRGETPEEILGFVEAYSERMLPFPRVQDGVDMAGTGGGAVKIGNISTAASFVLAGMGYRVVKHGNRSFTHKQGSADALENAGINIRLEPAKAFDILNKIGVVFLFAQMYHPAIGKVSGIRKALGFRTIFNKIGTFLNPARVGYHVMGVPDNKSLELMSMVGSMMDGRSYIFAYSEIGADELIYGTKNKALIVRNGKVEKLEIDFGTSSLMGIREEYNLEEILKGKTDAYILKSVALNCSAAMYLKNDIPDIKDGMRDAENSIYNGHAYAKFLQLRGLSNGS